MAKQEPPKLPGWALKILEQRPQPDVEFPDTRDLFTLLDFAVRIGGDPARRLAEKFEIGDVPTGVEVDHAKAWYRFAALTGSTDAAMRLGHLEKRQHAKDAAEMFEIALGDGYFSTKVAAAKALIEIGIVSDEAKKDIANLLADQNLKKHPDFRVIRDGFVRLTKEPLEGELAVKVASTAIVADGDFKPGIYAALEAPVRLTAVVDPDAIRESLDAEFPWFAEINERIWRELTALTFSSTPAFKLRPILLAGPPGVGKTTWCQRLAELAGVPFRVVAAGGSSDSMFLRGTPRGWSTARPGVVPLTIATEGIANPIIFVDEIDKASPDSRNGRIWDVMLQLLEPASARCFLDECLEVPLDLTWVSWVATANEIGKLPKPLLDRFEVMVVPRPGPEHTASVIRGSIHSFAKQLGLDPRMLPKLDVEDLEILDRCSNPREINRLVRTMIENKLVDFKKGPRN